LFCFPQVVQKQTFGVTGTSGHLIPSCVWNIRTKNYSDLIIRLSVTIDKFWWVFKCLKVYKLAPRFFRTFLCALLARLLNLLVGGIASAAHLWGH